MFQVLDIKASFNLLLSRPFMSLRRYLLSSLHQKVKMVVEGVPITLSAPPAKTEINDKDLIHIEHDDQDEDLWGFMAEEVGGMIEEDKAPLDFL